MDAEKFELLEARIRETATLVARLREEKQRLEEKNTHLRERIAELEEGLQAAQEIEARYMPNIDDLLHQLDTLHAEATGESASEPVALAIRELTEREEKGLEDYLELAKLHEQQSQYDQAIEAYQRTLRIDAQHFEATQRLAFLLEKLNRDTEAAPLWDKIWAMQEEQANPRRRRLR